MSRIDLAWILLLSAARRVVTPHTSRQRHDESPTGRPAGPYRRQRLGDGAHGSGGRRGARRGVGKRRSGSARDRTRHRPGSQPAAAATAGAAALAAARGRDGWRGGGRSRAGTGVDDCRPISRSVCSWETVGCARVSVPARVTLCVRQVVTNVRALRRVQSWCVVWSQRGGGASV